MVFRAESKTFYIINNASELKNVSFNTVCNYIGSLKCLVLYLYCFNIKIIKDKFQLDLFAHFMMYNPKSLSVLFCGTQELVFCSSFAQ